MFQIMYQFKMWIDMGVVLYMHENLAQKINKNIDVLVRVFIYTCMEKILLGAPSPNWPCSV